MPFPLFDRNPTARFPVLTILLIAANLGVAFWMHGLPAKQQLDLVYQHGLVPQRLSQMDSGKPVEIRRKIDNQVYKATLTTDRGSVYGSLLTMMFLHGGWFHVIPNMWMLWIFGNNVEDRLGRLVFVGFYLAGGILASYCQWLIDPASDVPVVGASGAVWAVLGGYAVTFPTAKVFSILFIGIPLLLDLPALLVIGLYFLVDLVLGLQMFQGGVGQQIAHGAHVGGCVAGAILMPVLGMGAPPPGSEWRSETEEMLEPLGPTIHRDNDR